MDVFAEIRELGNKLTGRATLRLSDLGNQTIDLSAPPYFDLSKSRRIFGASSATGTAQAPVTAVPTTTATWALFNGENEGGRSLSIISVFCWSVSGTLGLGLSLWGTVALAEVVGTKPTAYASSVLTSLSGGPSSTKAVIAGSQTMVGTPAWVCLAARDQVSAISVGSGLVSDGAYAGVMTVPPGYIAAATVLAPVGTTALFGVGFVFAEIDSRLAS